jgi:tetratricopeptide (TPR) repeat protein
MEELLEKGDVFDRKFAAEEALKFYLVAERLDPADVRVLLRVARQYRHLMADTPVKKEKLRLGHIALGYAQRAAAVAPNDAEAQLSIAITYGKMLPFLGTKEQVETSPRIKSAVDKTLALDPRQRYRVAYPRPVASRARGCWQRKARAGGGNLRQPAEGLNEQAAKCLEKAIALNPNRLMHYIELGRIYAQMGRYDDARRFINKGLAMPNAEKDDPDTKEKGGRR